MTPDPEPQPSLLRRLRPLINVALVVLAGVAIVGVASWAGRSLGGRFVDGEDTETVQVPPGEEVEVVIPSGATADQIADLLASTGVIGSATQFQVAVRSAGAAESLQAGTYQLVTGMDNGEVIDLLRRGPVASTYDILVKEGLRVDEILDVLAEESQLPRSDFEAALTDGSVATNLADIDPESEITAWEGLLVPDTYRFTEGATAADILNRMARTMEDRVSGIDWTGLEADGFSIYDGIVIASLIESEVRVAEERPLVSSVIRNRLADGMRLELDATVLYALGTRDIAEFDRGVESPWNTYRVQGLPPSPISAPGRAALEAAADPAETGYYFYVLSSPDGRHTFSETYEQHQAAVAQARADGVLP